MPVDCAQASLFLLELARGGSSKADADVQAHVRACSTCQRQVERERALDRALKLLPRTPLPESLARRLPASRPPPRRLKWEQAAVLVAAAACVGLFVVARGSPRNVAPDRLVEEAVNDHLRQLYRDKPVEVASSDHHQVKPWFAGRVDFAPVIHFEGDDEFPLVGGSVGYFLDRKAAVFSYSRRLHAISLLVLPSVGLDWPGGLDATASRGFNVVRWRDGDLAYALVSDLNAAELGTLAARIRGQK